MPVPDAETETTPRNISGIEALPPQRVGEIVDGILHVKGQ